MITFTLCLLALIAGYFIYGRFIERVFGPETARHQLSQKPTGWTIFRCLRGKSL